MSEYIKTIKYQKNTGEIKIYKYKLQPTREKKLAGRKPEPIKMKVRTLLKFFSDEELTPILTLLEDKISTPETEPVSESAVLIESTVHQA